MLKNTFFLFLCITLMSFIIQAQTTEPAFRIFDSKGEPVSMDRIIDAVKDVDVIFLGENHDDATAHALQLQIFKAVLDKYGKDRQVALSLEMFERDVQMVVNEYLRNQITEAHFLSASRPWNNYKTDYRPLVEIAKEKKLPVIAANAPRRYVNMVSRLGRGALDGLTPEAKKLLPPLPYAQASEAYSAKFKALMGPMPEAKMGLDNILDSQSLWDATMAYAVAEYLKEADKPLVVHLNGGFHTENRLGTPEHLMKYRKKAKFLVVTMRYEDDFKNFDKTKHEGIGDFVILTDKKVPRSFTRQ